MDTHTEVHVDTAQFIWIPSTKLCTCQLLLVQQIPEQQTIDNSVESWSLYCLLSPPKKEHITKPFWPEKFHAGKHVFSFPPAAPSPQLFKYATMACLDLRVLDAWNKLNEKIFSPNGGFFTVIVPSIWWLAPYKSNVLDTKDIHIQKRTTFSKIPSFWGKPPAVSWLGRPEYQGENCPLCSGHVALMAMWMECLRWPLLDLGVTHPETNSKSIWKWGPPGSLEIPIGKHHF